MMFGRAVRDSRLHMGARQEQSFQLSPVDLPPALEPNAEAVVQQALQQRPDLNAIQLNRDAAQRFAEAEKRLSILPVLVLGTAGGVPVHEQALHSSYGAAGINVNIPVLNGGLYSARQAEAELRAQVSRKDAESLAVEITRDVRIAWLEANTAFRRLDVTARLVAQANEALRLAQARYDIGLSGIVELNQAQFAQFSAQIGAARARYDYLHPPRRTGLRHGGQDKDADSHSALFHYGSNLRFMPSRLQQA